MAAKGSTTVPYPFTPEFERALVVLSATSKTFWGRIGHELDPKAVVDEAARLALEATRAIIEATSVVPGKPLLIIQRCRRWCDEGRVTQAQINAVSDLFEAVLEEGLPAEDAAVEEARPVLARRLESQALHAAMAAHANRQDQGKAKALIARSEQVGHVEQSPTHVVDDSAASLDAALANIEDSLSGRTQLTGCSELDDVLNDGVRVGQFVMFLAGSGGGKSMTLTQVAAEGVYRGDVVAYATLELNAGATQGRILANLLGMAPGQLIQLRKTNPAELHALHQQYIPREAKLGVRWFTPQITTAAEILEWVAEFERDIGRSVDRLVIDYADKLAVPKTRGKDESTYKGMELTYETFRLWADKRKAVCWTASQAKRKDKKAAKGGKGRLDQDDVADSIGKVRVADVVVTVNVSDDNSEVDFFVAKNRFSRGRSATSTLPCDYDVARIAPVNRVPVTYDLEGRRTDIGPVKPALAEPGDAVE